MGVPFLFLFAYCLETPLSQEKCYLPCKDFFRYHFNLSIFLYPCDKSDIIETRSIKLLVIIITTINQMNRIWINICQFIYLCTVRMFSGQNGSLFGMVTSFSQRLLSVDVHQILFLRKVAQGYWLTLNDMVDESMTSSFLISCIKTYFSSVLVPQIRGV